jgi:hypothetical protein
MTFPALHVKGEATLPRANASNSVQLLIILCQHPTVIPAQAGIQSFLEASPLYEFWIPACAGMTVG